MNTLMKCGHTAQGVDGRGRPVCVICIGINDGAETPDNNPLSLESRVAMCSSCDKEKPSSYTLPFFAQGSMRGGARDDTKDSFYCGCLGWD